MIRSPQFGAILLRASELIATQGQEVFEALNISLPANRISLVLAIHTQGPLSSTELASHIGLSRQLIESRLKQSVADGFFVSVPDERDSRKRVYDIAPKAKAEAAQIVTIMQEFEDVYDALWEEIEVNLEASLKSMEQALKKQSLLTRLNEQFPHHSIS